MSDSGGDALTLEIVREFDATPEKLFELFGSEEHLVHWWTPREQGHYFTTPYCKVDFRKGGRWRMCLLSPTGSEYWQGGSYTLLDPPSRLEFTFQWDEKEGQPDNEMQVSIRFDGLPGGRTRMTFRQWPFLEASQRDGHNGSWTAVFDALKSYVTAN
ncbi:SRPBCC domain-containing protein [bacterium]|nr:SRPBCC domain-containing protein [bacterium]